MRPLVAALVLVLAAGVGAHPGQPRPVRLGHVSRVQLSAAAEPLARASRPRQTLLALWMVYVTNQWSRGLLPNSVSFVHAALREPHRYVNVALDFGPAAYGFLLSAFTCAYALTSVPAGVIADARKRVATLTIACVAWALAVLLHASATSMPTLILSRVLHGAAAAFCSPLANSLISDAFSEGQRGLAYSVYASGIYAGTALAILSGSASALSSAATPAAKLGWRACARALGAFSLLSALVLAATVPEPARAARARPVGVGPADSVQGELRQLATQGLAGVRLVLSCRPALLSLCAVGTRLCAGFTIASWLPPLCKARFPGEERAFATMYAAIVCLGGMAASILGGLLSDMIRRRSTRPNSRAIVPLVGSLLAAPLFAMAVTRSTLPGTMAWFLAHVLCSECWMGPTIATMLDSLPADARGTAQGLSNFVQIGGGLLQAAIAPAVAQFGLARALQVTVPTAYVLSAAVFLAVLRCQPAGGGATVVKTNK